MEFEFVLPQKFEDLLVSTGNLYRVTQVFDDKTCPEKLRQASLSYKKSGYAFIFDEFDVFYSIIDRASKLTNETILRAMEVLYRATDDLGKGLAEFLQNSDNTENQRHSNLNAIKMYVFLIVSLVKKIDKDVLVNDGKKHKKNSLEEINQSRWEERRYLALLQLLNVVNLPLENLWVPPVPEEMFVNYCAEFAYRTIEHPVIKDKDTVESTVFQIFGVLLKTYNHSLIFPVRIVELIRNNETAALAIASGLVILHEQFGINTIIQKVVDQLINSLDGDVSDGPVIKNISAFFIELGNISPTLIMPHLRECAGDVMNLESYQLRICFLQLMSEIIVTELTGENLTPEQKEARNEYLEHLKSHIHDVNAHVRQKTLQIWSRLKNEDAVPLAWTIEILDLAAGRLEDKSSLARRTAIQLIKLFLEKNPYSAKLPIEELEQRYETKRKELSDLRTKMNEESDKQEGITERFDEIAQEMKDDMIKVMGMESIDDEDFNREDCEQIYTLFPKLLEEKEYFKILLLVRKIEELNGNWKEVREMEPALSKTYLTMVVRSHFLMQNQFKNYEEEYKTTECAVRFLEDSLKFSAVLVRAVPKLQEMLMSKTESDVTEAIDFFTSAYLFGIKDTEVGMRQLLYLVWSVGKDKRGPIRDAYKRILFDNDHQGRAQAFRTVMNILRFIENLTYSQFIAFEELLKEFIISEEIDSTMIQVMFEVYTKKLENITDNDSRLALQLLVVCSNANPSIVRSNCNLIEDLCFNHDNGTKDTRVYTLSLDFMMNYYADRETEIYTRVDESNPRVQKIIKTFHNYFLCEDSPNFDEVCSKTFQYIYKMCNLPNKISENIIRDLYTELTKLSETYSKDAQVTNNRFSEIQGAQEVLTQGLTQPNIQNPDDNMFFSTIHLSRFIFMIGYIAMRELIYLDVDVFSNLKYRQELTELKKNKKKTEEPNKRKSVMNVSSASALKRKSLMPPQPDDEEQEEDIVGQSSEDAFVEQVNAIFEKEMLFSKDSYFRRFAPMIFEILRYPKKYADADLQRSAVLALLHFMSVSSEFCEKHMPFLFNVFTHSTDIEIKCNIIIGMSDLTFRFPNVIEPWSGHLYSTLHDENRDLRLTAVRILSHLISHEMILVKGQISDLALCLVDVDDEIRQSTEVFFKEIAHKSNILYNVLPDIISRLSDPKLQLVEGRYQVIMKYIIGLISKDKQIEGLVEKLCYRFKVTEQERQWRDIAFCLSLLSYTEKTIKKLIDNIVMFKDKVQVQEVYDYFKTIISNASKLAKPEMKAVVQDFETRLEECLAVNENLDKGNETEVRLNETKKAPPVGRGKGKAAAQKSAKKPPTRRGGRKVVEESSGESDSESENLPPRRRKGKKERVILESDDEEEIVKTPVAPRGRGARSKVVHETSSSASDSVTQRPSKRRK